MIYCAWAEKCILFLSYSLRVLNKVHSFVLYWLGTTSKEEIILSKYFSLAFALLLLFEWWFHVEGHPI